MYAVPLIQESLFPRAAGYRNLLSGGAVHESSRRYFPYSERHLQALWFDESIRPRELKSSRGEPVLVECPGRWNLEAGPDFSGAVLRIGRDQRRVAGDAEIHIVSNDWKQHGHHSDPRYAQVRFHVTWFSGSIDESLFPPGTVHIALCDRCTHDLESIDVTAYPYAAPCTASFPLVGQNPDEIFQVLEGAGEERLRKKTQRLAGLMQQRGAAQALYEETAAALGYKHNKAPFRMLAQRLPLEVFARYGSDWNSVYAVLLGIAGLLPKQPGSRWSTASRAELRALWDRWWHEAHRWEEIEPMTRSDWDFSGLRPLNHPVRRFCALAQWVAHGFFQAVEEDPLALQRATLFCDCFWTEHVGWTGTEKQAALVGTGRMQAIDLNVFAPYRLATGDASALENLTVEPMNSVIRETAYTLFGPDHSPKLYRSALARQGLIQIFNDFVLTGRSLSALC